MEGHIHDPDDGFTVDCPACREIVEDPFEEVTRWNS